MREISILKILSTFSNKEKKDFKIFLESPGFVSRRKVIGLYEILLRDNPEMNDNFDKKSAYKELFPEEWKSKGYNDATIRNSLYELQRSAEKFLVFNKINSNEVLFDEILRKELRERHLDKLYIKELDTYEKLLEKKTKLGSDFFLHHYKFSLEKKNYESMYSDFLIKRNKKIGIEEIDDIARHLTYYFILELLYLNDGAEKYAMRFNEEYEKSFLYRLCEKINVNEFISFLAHEDDSGNAAKVFKIYEKFFNLFENADEKEYYDLKKFVLKNAEMFDTNTRSHIFFQFVKYCSLNPMGLNEGKEFSSELFNILKIMVDNGYYEHTEGPYFQVDLYRILFLMGCDEGEIEWTEKFIEKFALQLPPEFQKTAYHCGKAHVLFSKKDYNSAHNELNKMDEEYFNLEVDKKILLIRIFYETGAYDQAVSLINSMQRYIDESNKVSFTLKEKINNFLRLTLKLIKETEIAGKKNLIELKFDIQSTLQVRGKKWLMEKASG
jgi:hypothetical protein